jgi:hypothetical protein
MRYAILLGILMLGAGDEPEAWVFFSPDSPDATRLFSELRKSGIRIRPVLLTDRYFGKREPADPFIASLTTAGEVRVVDEDGLHEADRLKIRDLPAVALRRGTRTHVACGTQADLQELLRCSR